MKKLIGQKENTSQPTFKEKDESLDYLIGEIF